MGEEYVGNMKDPLRVNSTILITGFTSGEIGLWLNGFMMRTIQAHAPGPKVGVYASACTHVSFTTSS